MTKRIFFCTVMLMQRKIGFPGKVKEVDLKSLVNFGSDMGQIWGKKVSYNYGNLTIYYGNYNFCNPEKRNTF